MLNQDSHKVVIIVFFKIYQFIFEARFVYKNVLILNLLCIYFVPNKINRIGLLGFMFRKQINRIRNRLLIVTMFYT